MVKDASEARLTSKTARAKAGESADVISILKEIDRACANGQERVRIYELLTIGQHVRLGQLGFRIDSSEQTGGDCVPSYVVTWEETLSQYKRRMLREHG